MFFSYWIAMLIPILLGPMQSHRLYARIFEKERTRIALDNGAVVVGEADRGWLEWLASENAALRAWDAAHHPWHLCKLSLLPQQAATCLAADRLWEGAILTRHARVRAEIQLRWSLASARARTELSRLAVQEPGLSRAAMPELRPRRCGVCQGPLGWEVVRLPSTRVWGGRSPRQEALVRLSRWGRGFQYEILE